VLVAGEANGGNERGPLMDDDHEQKQVQEDRRGGILGAACSGCDWFTDGVDGPFLLPAG
jgi:hypothetical protein